MPRYSRSTCASRIPTQLGRSEELGSGTRTLYEHSRYYSGWDPVLKEGNFFTAFVPSPIGLPRHSNDESAGEVRNSSQKFAIVRDTLGEALTKQLSEGELVALELIITGKRDINSDEVAEAIVITRRGAQKLLSKLMERGIVTRIGAARSTRYRLATLRKDA